MYKHILVPIDGSPASMRGLAEAVQLAKESNATVRILHVVDEFVPDLAQGPGIYYDEWVKALREGGKSTLTSAVGFAKARGIEPQSQLIDTLARRAADVIVEHAKQWPADLLVMGTHGRRGVKRLVMGSDAELVLRQSPVPVLMVRAPDEEGKTKAHDWSL